MLLNINLFLFTTLSIIIFSYDLIFCQTKVFDIAEIPDNSAYVISLDGTWRFKIEQTKGFDLAERMNGQKPKPINYPRTFEPFYKTDYKEDSKWIDIKAPGNWEMANQSLATYYQPDNSSGFYRLWFEVPETWKGRIVRIQFDGVQNGAEIWLNGKPVPVSEPSCRRLNYHESGWTAFQVDLTSVVKYGTKNLLALRVTKNTRSSNLDSGDFFFLGGIYRTVKLFSVPKTNISDITVQTHLLPNNKAEVKVITDIEESNSSIVSMQLINATQPIETKVENNKTVLTQIVDNPKLWSAEYPNLYNLKVELKDSAGKAVEEVSKLIGIREVTIKNGELLLNGVPVKFAGVCRHEISATDGSAVGENLWRKDITMMKAANINAIRTSHYPYGSGFYDLCDSLGMYVVDELPYVGTPTNDPKLKPAFEQRALETIRRDKNHPSVVIWAIGNELKPGSNLQVVSDLVKQLDTTRPTNVSWFSGDVYNTKLSDSHYTTPAQMEENAKKELGNGKPHIYLENPNCWDIRLAADPGAWVQWGIVLQRVWKVCMKYPTIPGTFLWEWQDRAIIDHNPVKYYTYYPKTGILLVKLKGLVDAFRNPRPWLYEVKMVYSPIKIEDTITATGNKLSFNVENHYSFTNLSYLKMVWKLERNDSTIKSGSMSVNIPPLKNGIVEIPFTPEELKDANALRVDFVHPDGNNVVAHRFILKKILPKSHLALPLPAGLAIPEFNLVTRETKNDPITWRKMFRYHAHLTNIVDEPSSAKTLSELKLFSANVVGGPEEKVIGRLNAEYHSGKFKYRFEYTGDTADVQEIGWAFYMPEKFDHFSWNRKGRWTIYPKDNIGRLQGTARPSSMNAQITKMDHKDAFDFNSTKYNCSWASLTNADGSGLRVEFNAKRRFQCRGGVTENGTENILFVNQVVCPPEDGLEGIVKDLYLKLKPGDVIDSSFRIGANE